MNEFELIERHFRRPCPREAGVVLGIGDDAALLAPPPGTLLACTQVTVFASAADDARTLAEQAVTRAAARLACVAGSPRWATLALTLPDADRGWLDAFSASLARSLSTVDACLVGGDTTRGPLTVTLGMHGPAARERGAPATPGPGRLWLLERPLAELPSVGRRLAAAGLWVVTCEAQARRAADALAAETGLTLDWRAGDEACAEGALLALGDRAPDTPHRAAGSLRPPR